MTADQFRSYMNRRFGMEQAWPQKFEVDAETYGNICNDVIRHALDSSEDVMIIYGFRIARVAVGRNGGLMFKGVEILLKKNELLSDT